MSQLRAFTSEEHVRRDAVAALLWHTDRTVNALSRPWVGLDQGIRNMYLEAAGVAMRFLNTWDEHQGMVCVVRDQNPADDHCHRHLTGVTLHAHGAGTHWHLDTGPAGATLADAGWTADGPDHLNRVAGGQSEGGTVADDALASAELAGCALGPAFRRVLVQVATGELTVDEAIRIARRDLESDLTSTLDVEAGLREVLDTRRDQQR